MDWLFFGSFDESPARLFLRVGLTALTFSVLFFFLFAKWYVGQVRRRDLLFVVATALPVVLVWTVLLQPNLIPTGWDGFAANFDLAWFGVWITYIVGYIFGGIILTYRASRIVGQQSRLLGRRVLAITISLAVALVFGLVTNTLFAVVGLSDFPPLFSTLMVFPGVLTVRALMPTAGTRISTAMMKWARKQFELVDAFLIYENGTLIASRGKEGEAQLMDDDIFGATLDAIQSFMKTSFPYLVGKWLRTVEHGDMRIILERGQYSYLALVIRGMESDFLRRQMIEALHLFEEKNADIKSWDGVVDDLRGLDDLFNTFYKEMPVL